MFADSKDSDAFAAARVVDLGKLGRVLLHLGAR